MPRLRTYTPVTSLGLINEEVDAIYAAIAAGGGSPYSGKYHEDRPSTETVFVNGTDELKNGFERTWRIFNSQSGQAFIYKWGKALLERTSPTATSKLFGYYIDVPPSGDFLLAAKVTPFLAGSFNSCGLIALTGGSEATPTDLEVLRFNHAGTNFTHDFYTDYSLGGAVSRGTLTMPTGYNGVSWPVYLLLLWTGGVLTSAVSFDDITWRVLDNSSTARPLAWGVVLIDNSASAVPRMAVHWARCLTTGDALQGKVGS